MRNHFEFYRCNVRVIVILAFCSLGISQAVEMYIWKKGKVYYAPLWVGYHYQNGNLCRIGMSGKNVHQMTQKAVYRIIGFPGYNSYSNTISYGYSYYGRRNPVSIW